MYFLIVYYLFLISPHICENRVSFFVCFQIEMETVEVFIKTEEDDEKDSLEQHTPLTPVEMPCVEPLNPER